jgi:hypothetical protein
MAKHYTMEQYKLLCRAYNDAVILGLEQFQVGGQTLLTNYAKYLLEHMASVLEPELPRD